MSAWLCFKMGDQTWKDTELVRCLWVLPQEKNSNLKQISCISTPPNLLDYCKSRNNQLQQSSFPSTTSQIIKPAGLMQNINGHVTIKRADSLIQLLQERPISTAESCPISELTVGGPTGKVCCLKNQFGISVTAQSYF